MLFASAGGEKRGDGAEPVLDQAYGAEGAILQAYGRPKISTASAR